MSEVSDIRAAEVGLMKELTRVRTNMEALLMRQDLPDRDKLEWAFTTVQVVIDLLQRSLDSRTH